MIGSYIVFFMAIFVATGGERGANFAIVVSVLYTAMYFGTAKVLLNLGAKDVRPFTSRPGSVLQTWTGPMSHGAVAGQMLIVPVMIGFFAVAVAIIRAFVG
jgi:hypothetical protein